MRIEQLWPGSYKGVEFLMRSAGLSGGRKTVKHEFPASDKQVIEDLGRVPRAYNVSLVIGGGELYVQTRDRLLQVLEEGGAGKLSHPFYGDIENVVVRDFTLDESLEALGEGRLKVNFEISEGTGLPERSTNTLNAIESGKNAALVAITEGFTAGYNVPLNQPSTYIDAKAKGVALASAFLNNIEFSSIAAAGLDQIKKDVQYFQSAIPSLVSDSADYIQAISDLFNAIPDLYANPVDVIERFFTYGDNDTEINITTTERQTRYDNRATLNAAVQAWALSLSYFYSAQVDYLNVSEIEKRAASLETQYKKVKELDGLADEAADALTDLRVTTGQFFEQEKLTARQLVTVTTGPTSARLLAFHYYGDSSTGEQLAELNDISEPSFISGAIEILSA